MASASSANASGGTSSRKLFGDQKRFQTDAGRGSDGLIEMEITRWRSVSVLFSHPAGRGLPLRVEPQRGDCQLWGSSSSMRLFNCVGSLVRTSLRSAQDS